jgi:hypothetical protein
VYAMFDVCTAYCEIKSIEIAIISVDNTE